MKLYIANKTYLQCSIDRLIWRNIFALSFVAIILL